VTVEIFPVEKSLLPQQVQNLKRTRFYYEDQDSRTEFKLTPVATSAVYNERVQQLAHQLVLLLRDIRDRHAAKDPAADPSGPAEVRADPGQPPPPAHASAHANQVPSIGKTVLLAQVTDDLYDERQQVLSYLEDLGVKVIPEGEYPEGGAKFAAAVKTDIEQADLFVQLLSRVRSTKPDDLRAGESEQAKSYAQFQYDAALRRKIPVLQWRHPDINPATVTHWDRQLLEGPDVRVMGLQEFMKDIRSTIDRLRRPPPAPPPSASGSFYFINADSSDQDIADSLAKVFKSKSKTAFRPMYKGSAREIEQDLEENLIGCNSVVLIYGKASLAWVRAQLRRCNKLTDQREKQGQRPLRPVVLVAPPPPKDDIGGEGDFDTIYCLDGPADDHVQRLIDEQRP
jgi:hypothetical protein